MAYLVTFHWGWLLASLLLGLAMGWIAVVHRAQAVSKVTSRWLGVLAAALVAAALARVIPGRQPSPGDHSDTTTRAPHRRPRRSSWRPASGQ